MLKLLTVSLLVLGFAETVKSAKGGESSESSESSNSESSSESSGGESSSGGSGSKSNYYKSYFADREIGYAVGQCSSADYTDTVFLLPTCDDNTHITVSYHSSPNCSDITLTSSNSYNSSEAEFRCNGQDTYAAVLYALDSTCTLNNPTYFALDVCISQNVFNHAMMTCTSYMATLGLYYAAQCAGTANFTYNAETNCTAPGFLYGGETVYWEFLACSTATPAPTPSTTTVSGETGETSSSESSESSGSGSGGGSFSTTQSYTTTSSSSTGGSGGSSPASFTGNMMSLKNIFGIFMMIACVMIGQL